VELQQIDVVGSKPGERSLAGAADIGGRRVRSGRLGITLLCERVSELGRDHDAIAIRSERLAEDPLAVSGAVDVGGIEERNAEVECRPDRSRRLAVVDGAPADRLPVGALHRSADRPAAPSRVH